MYGTVSKLFGRVSQAWCRQIAQEAAAEAELAHGARLLQPEEGGTQGSSQKPVDKVLGLSPIGVHAPPPHTHA